MRIDFNQGAPPATEANQANTQQAATSATQVSHSQVMGQDQAQLSGVHAQVQALAAQAAQLPEVRQEKVTALRQALAAGRYQTDPERVAGAMIAGMIEGPAA